MMKVSLTAGLENTPTCSFTYLPEFYVPRHTVKLRLLHHGRTRAVLVVNSTEMFTAFSVPGELSVIVSLLLVQGPHAFWKRLYPTQLPSKGDLRSVDCGYPKPRPPRNLREKMSVSRLVAVFTTVPEMQACPPEEIHDSMVRVVGRLLRYETKDSLVWLGHYEPPYLELPVDCSLVQPFPFSQGALFQFIGEVDGSGRTCGGRLTLRALAHRCVEGLDMALYRKALAVRNARE